MQHDYEQLGERRFQQFCQALLVAEHPDMACLPVGMPDGGRDGLLDRLSEAADGRELVVFQIKFVERPGLLKDATKWAEEILDGERPKLEALLDRGAKRYVLITNVAGTSHLDKGSIDRVQKVLDTLPLPAQCLWRADLDRRLEGQWDLKWSYPELMTGTDLIRALVEGRLSEAGERRARALKAFLADQHRKDREVRFKQVDLRNDLLDVFIDVPARVQRQHDDDSIELAAWVRRLARQDMDVDELYVSPFRSYGAGSLLLDPWVQGRALKVVVEGAPGQGKSTMVQYVCQVHRMMLLSKDAELSRLPDEHRQSGLRVPIKVELRELAQWLSGVNPFDTDGEPPASEERSLEGFVAALIRCTSGGAHFDVGDLHAIATISPLLLALDGLDEVVDIGDRNLIVEEISRAVDRLDALSKSIQVIVTSRPASFTNARRFAEPFQYLILDSITKRLIEVYRDRWLNARELELSERRELSTTLDEKLDQPHFRDLCRNPMQLAIILSLLHRKGPALPERRTDLYRSYMEYFLDREATKSRSVRDHRELLMLLHGHIACLLHMEAERSSRRAGRISTDDLIQTAEAFVSSRGHRPDLFSDLFGGVIDRFGALVSRVQGTFEFEVQPLREYFAGFYLYETAPYSPVGDEHKGARPERLDAMLRHRFWLNVARFYAGCYSVGELESLAGRLEALAEDRDFSATALPRTVTAQLLADWTLAQDPRAQQRAVNVMLRDLGVRHAGSGDDQDGPIFADRPFTLPARSGGAEFIDALFKTATDEHVRGGRLAAIAHTLVVNASPHELAQRWLEAAPRPGTHTWEQWNQLGARLSVFRAMDRAQVAAFLRTSPADPSSLALLVKTGVFWPADESPADGRSAIDYVLSADDDMIYDPELAAHPLFALNTLTRLDRIAAAREMGRYYYDREWALPVGDWPEHYGDVCTLAARYHRWEEQRCQWWRQLEPWTDVVDAGRSLFGERNAFDRLALISSAVRDASHRGRGHSELHDDKRSLVLRARHARYRAGAPDWWREQLEGAPDLRTERIAITLMLAWAAGPTVEALENELTQRIERMPSDCYAQVYGDLEDLALFHRRDRRFAPIKIETLSARLFAALAIRRSEREMSELYRRAQYGIAPHDWPVLVQLLRCELALVEKGSTKERWQPVLALMRQAVQIAAPSELTYLRGPRTPRMPEDVAREIIAEADLYPLAAVRDAESCLGDIAARRTMSVGRIAGRDGWLRDSG